MIRPRKAMNPNEVDLTIGEVDGKLRVCGIAPPNCHFHINVNAAPSGQVTEAELDEVRQTVAEHNETIRALAVPEVQKP